MSTRKTNLVFATVWFVYWSRKEMRFLCKKVSSRTPAVTGQTPRQQTINREEGPTPGPGPCVAVPQLTSAFLFFPVSSTLHQHTEAFQHPLRELKNHSHTAGLVLIPMGRDSTKRPEDGLKQGWNCWIRVHGPENSDSIILCSQTSKPEVNRIGEPGVEG